MSNFNTDWKSFQHKKRMAEAPKFTREQELELIEKPIAEEKIVRQVKFKDLPVEDYDKFRMECDRIKEEGPFILVLVDADLTNTKNPEFKHIKYSMLPAIYADKVVYKDKILLETSEKP